MALAVLLLTAFMGVFDLFAVTIAAPSIEADLRASFGEIQLIVAGYVLVYGSALVAGAWLGDRHGRRRVLLLGTGAFALCSLACAAAPSGVVLVVCRVLQGLAAALALPQVLALIQTHFSGHARGRAVGLYAATIGLASVLGQVLGGLLVSADIAGLGWRTIFLVNPLLAVVVWRTGSRSLTESWGTPARADLAGAALLTVGLLGFLLAVVEGANRRWPSWSVTLLCCSLGVLAAFAALQRRRSEAGRPALLPRRLLRQRTFTTGLLVVLAFYGGLDALILVLAYYLQAGLGVTPGASGIVLAPLGLGMVAASVVANPLHRRYGVASMQAGAGLMGAASLALVVMTDLSAGSGPGLLPPVLLAHGVGQGLLAAPLITAILARVDPVNAGSASGVLLTLIQVANALGVALVGGVFAAMLPAHTTIADASGAALTPVFRVAFGVLVALAVVTALALRLMRGARRVGVASSDGSAERPGGL